MGDRLRVDGGTILGTGVWDEFVAHVFRSSVHGGGIFLPPPLSGDGHEEQSLGVPACCRFPGIIADPDGGAVWDSLHHRIRFSGDHLVAGPVDFDEITRNMGEYAGSVVHIKIVWKNEVVLGAVQGGGVYLSLVMLFFLSSPPQE